MIYNGNDLKDLDLWTLGDILKSLVDAEEKRAIASQHEKFKKMEFPPPNPAFVELKAAVELEIRNKQGLT